MGSKTPQHQEDQRYNDPSQNGSSPNQGGEKRGSHLARDGDGCMVDTGAGDGSEEEDDDDDDDDAALVPPSLKDEKPHGKSKKKRSRKSKKKQKDLQLVQSSPPRIALKDLFTSGEFPTGELLDYEPSESRVRTRSLELRHEKNQSLNDSTFLNDYRKAAEVHRQTRKWVQETVKPGHTLTEIAVGIEDSVRALLDNNGLETGQSLQAGMGFPTGLALNNCVAHYTPNAGQKDIVLQYDDVMKVDFGVHINGWIVDSAFTMAFDPTYDNLLAAVKAATNQGIKAAGIDVRICDVSAEIQEVMESYEVEIDGKTIPVKAVRSITGHNILQNRIHGGKSVPFVKNNNETKMEEGEVFAIETFGTTGRGYLTDGTGVYGYGLNYNLHERVTLPPLTSARKLYRTIKDNFGTLVFCRRYLDRLGCDRYLAGLNCLVSNGIVDRYEPLMDIPGSYSAQYEHTILLREAKKEVISRGEDY